MVLIENPSRPRSTSSSSKPKNISLHWEFMFGRVRYQAENMKEQGRLLNEVSELIDAGLIRSTLQTNIGAINAVNMKQAHALVESGKTIGKVVLSDFTPSVGIH